MNQGYERGIERSLHLASASAHSTGADRSHIHWIGRAILDAFQTCNNPAGSKLRRDLGAVNR